VSEEPARSRGGRELVELDEYRARVGAPATPSQWVLVDQPMVDSFARLTDDEAFIHVDPELAARSLFGGTVAHGLLLTSLLPKLMRDATPLIRGTAMGANYGYDRIRYPASLRVGTRVRGWFTLTEIEPRGPDRVVLHFDVRLAAEGQEKPVLTCHWLLMRWMRPAAD